MSSFLNGQVNQTASFTQQNLAVPSDALTVSGPLQGESLTVNTINVRDGGTITGPLTAASLTSGTQTVNGQSTINGTQVVNGAQSVQGLQSNVSADGQSALYANITTTSYVNSALIMNTLRAPGTAFKFIDCRAGDVIAYSTPVFVVNGQGDLSSAGTGSFYGQLTSGSLSTGNIAANVITANQQNVNGDSYLNGPAQITHSNAGAGCLLLTPSSATYANSVLFINTTRAADPAFNLIDCRTAGSQKFVVDGTGKLDINTTSTTASAVRIYPNSASYTGTALYIAAGRAANSAYNMLDCRANGVSQLLVNGKGDVTAAGSVSAGTTLSVGTDATVSGKLQVNNTVKCTNGLETASGSFTITTSLSSIHTLTGSTHAIVSASSASGYFYMGYAIWVGNLSAPQLYSFCSQGIEATIDLNATIFLKRTSGSDNTCKWNVTYLSVGL